MKEIVITKIEITSIRDHNIYLRNLRERLTSNRDHNIYLQNLRERLTSIRKLPK